MANKLRKRSKPPRKSKPMLVVALAESIDQALEETVRRYSTTKTSLVQRALTLFFHVDRDLQRGAKICIHQTNGAVETLIL